MSEVTKTRIFALLSAIIYFIVGGVILLNPGVGLISFVYAIGVLLLLGGIFLVVDGIRLPSFIPYRFAYVLDGILLAILGALFVFGNSLVNISVLAYMLIFWFIISAIIQIFLVWSVGGWVSVVSIILNAIVIVLAVFSIGNPAVAEGILIWYLALEFIVAGINRLFIVFAPTDYLD